MGMTRVRYYRVLLDLGHLLAVIQPVVEQPSLYPVSDGHPANISDETTDFWIQTRVDHRIRNRK
jgi:hypothetical protein